MSVDLSDKKSVMSESESESEPAKPGLLDSIRTGLRELQYGPPLLYGIGAGVLMTVALLDPKSIFALIAGIIPVTAGLLMVRKLRGHYGLHGFAAGLFGSIASMAVLAILLYLTPLGPQLVAAGGGGTVAQELAVRGMLPALMLLIFCTFGASTSGRMEERNRTLRAEVAERGGQLERPSTIRGVDDIRGLSLPQLGSYVNNLFKKKGFAFKDYRFIDKDKHLDLWMEREGETWHLRMSVADRITPGTVESLLQDMKREGCTRGVVITSTEFTPGTQKAAKDRPVVLIDGPMLYDIAEG